MQRAAWRKDEEGNTLSGSCHAQWEMRMHGGPSTGPRTQRAWTDIGEQTGNTAGTRRRRSNNSERFARCYAKYERIIFNS